MEILVWTFEAMFFRLLLFITKLREGSIGNTEVQIKMSGLSADVINVTPLPLCNGGDWSQGVSTVLVFSIA